MKIFTEIIGNLFFNPEWKEKLNGFDIEHVELDQWTAQKSRFLVKSDQNNEYAVALKRHTQVINGDILEYNPETKKAVVIQIQLSPVLVIDLSALLDKGTDLIIQRCVELGHAIGNQHWPAVIKHTKIYVPLTVDKKVMISVMDTHHIEGVTYEFQPGLEIIPYLAPHEIRRLFGGTGPESHTHEHIQNHLHGEGQDSHADHHAHSH
ncbi:MAG: urease accessory protein UreE [Bacteroidales bacterium]